MQNAPIPHGFGPFPNLTVARFPREFIFSLVYLTDEAALTSVLPKGLTPAGPPLLQFRYRFSDQLDWALNSSHRAFGVSVPCRVEQGDQVHEGVHWLALWENDYLAVTLGREVFGVAKLGADIFYQSSGGEHRALLSEAGRPLMELRFRAGTELDGDALDEVRQRSAANKVLGYKHIPNSRGDAAVVSHPTVYRHTVAVERAWHGDGEVLHHHPDPAVHLWSAPVVNGIRELPLLRPVGAVLTEGSAELDLSTGQDLRDEP